MSKGTAKYTEDFKKSIVSLYHNGKTQSRLHEEYGVSPSALARWIKAYSEVKLDDNTVITSDKRLGAHKMCCLLKTEYGIQISVGRVYRLMRGMQLPKMSTEKPPVASRHPKQDDSSCRNILKQQFNPQEPDRVWASDITYVRTGKGFHYVCVVLDLFSRKVIAWRVGHKADTQFVVDTVEEAYLKRGRPQSVLFHSDRGSQYTSEQFRRFLDERNIVQSFSAPGYPYDNAVVESFFKFFKKEELNRRYFRDQEELRRSAFVYIEGFYNPKRPHSANGNLSPDGKEDWFKKQNTSLP